MAPSSPNKIPELMRSLLGTGSGGAPAEPAEDVKLGAILVAAYHHKGIPPALKIESSPGKTRLAACLNLLSLTMPTTMTGPGPKPGGGPQDGDDPPPTGGGNGGGGNGGGGNGGGGNGGGGNGGGGNGGGGNGGGGNGGGGNGGGGRPGG